MKKTFILTVTLLAILSISATGPAPKMLQVFPPVGVPLPPYGGVLT